MGPAGRASADACWGDQRRRSTSLRAASLAVGLLIAAVGPMTVGENAMAAPPSPHLHVRYRCDDGRVVEATYPRDPAGRGAILTIDGRRIAFATALSADGARYIANESVHARRRVQWWIKGDDATLSEAPIGQGDEIAGASRTSTCHVVREAR
jgi:membrane-bound inhibitor of C-type lysozyme